MLNSIISNNMNTLKLLLDKHKVQRLYAFGSVCSERFNDLSDIDFLIKFKSETTPIERGENWFALLDGFRLIFKRDVDIITEDSLLNPYFIENINSSKELIYEA